MLCACLVLASQLSRSPEFVGTFQKSMESNYIVQLYNLCNMSLCILFYRVNTSNQGILLRNYPYDRFLTTCATLHTAQHKEFLGYRHSYRAVVPER